MNNADIIVSDTDPTIPGAEGNDTGVGQAEDYKSVYGGADSIGPESKPLPDENKKTGKKDTITKSPAKKEDDGKPIGSPVEKPKKKGLLKRIFGSK
jgi:penicillin-binding protein 1A